MPYYSAKSKLILETCHSDLQRLFNEVILYFDCSIICGTRGEEEQNKAFADGFSDKKFPFSKHNKSPSKAVDVVPYPIKWKDKSRMYFFGGYVKATAEYMNIKIRWGGDWDSDTEVNDQGLIDLPHFELV